MAAHASMTSIQAPSRVGQTSCKPLRAHRMRFARQAVFRMDAHASMTSIQVPSRDGQTSCKPLRAHRMRFARQAVFRMDAHASMTSIRMTVWLCPRQVVLGRR